MTHTRLGKPGLRSGTRSTTPSRSLRSASRKSCINSLRNNPGLEPFAIYRQTQYKKPLWVLVQGDYPDLNSARLALQAFPETLQQREKLWIRRFEMVQRLLE